MLAGLGVAAKVTFAVVALAPAVLARSRRQLMVYIAALTATAGVLMTPILLRISRLVEFLARFAYRSGEYGGGSTGFSTQEYLRGARLLVLQNKVPAIVLLASIVVLLALRSTSLRDRIGRVEFRTLGVVTLLELLSYALVARQAFPRYLIPAVLLMGVNLFVLHGIATTVWAQRRRTVHVVAAVSLVLLTAVWMRNVASQLASLRSETADRLATVDAATSLRKSGAVVISGTWSSAPSHAFAMGEFWVGDAWRDVAEKVYPDQLALSGEGYLRNWHESLGSGWNWPDTGVPLSPEAERLEWQRFHALLKDHRVIVQGDDVALRHNPEITYHVIRASRLESLFEVQSRSIQ